MDNDGFLTTEELINAKKKFSEFFGDTIGIHATLTPASLILLGDHTHYNDGILLSAALNRYTTVVVRKRHDTEINIADVHSNVIHTMRLDNIVEYNDQSKLGLGIIKLLYNERHLNKGFDLLITSDIPDSLGLGNTSSYQVGLAYALKKVFNIPIECANLMKLIRKNDLQMFGKISNFAHLYTTRFEKENRLFYFDQRNQLYKTILPNKNNFTIIILDTGEKIHFPQNTCNERIEECEVGVKGLRLYIWGIKNLRDVELDFLLKHYHMLPKKIFNRILYNVKERIRAENAIKALKKNGLIELGKYITESHWSLANDYDLSCDKCNFLVEKSVNFKGVYGSKMISCTPKNSTFNIVNNDSVDSYIEYIKKSYVDKFDEDLKVYALQISKGIKEISTKEIDNILC